MNSIDAWFSPTPELDRQRGSGLDESMECIALGFALCEAPVYHPASRGVLVSDAIAGGVWLVSAEDRVEPFVAHRRGVGGAALHADGGLVVSGRNVAHKRDGTTTALLEQTGHHGYTHFNDLTTDSSGRVYVALVDMPMERVDRPKPGMVFRIEVDGSATVAAEDIAGPNGMAFSPDGTSFHVSDTHAGVIWRYDVDTSGDLTNRRAWAHLHGEGPDGLAMAADGSVWVALHDGSAVAHLDPHGRELTRVTTPVPATSVCFGGEDLRTLFVTAGSTVPGSRQGCVFRRRVDGPGLPVTAAGVTVARRSPRPDRG